MNDIIKGLLSSLAYHREEFKEALNCMHHHQAQIMMYEDAIKKLQKDDK